MGYLTKQGFEVNNLLIVESENECLGGIGKLEEKLKLIFLDLKKRPFEKIGIIFDADKVGIDIRKKQIQEKINLIFGDNSEIFSIYIMNIKGEGELETVLKEIKSKDSTIADCLESWQECLPTEKKLKQKDFDKFWIQIYQRYDCCTKTEQKRAGEKCNNQKSFSKEIYNFENPILEDLKVFLRDLGENDE